MLLIVAHHYSVHGGWEFPNNLFNKVYIDAFGLGGKLGVDVFVFIFGFYQVRSSFNINKMIKLYSQIWFYSISILIVGLILPIYKVSIKSIITSIFPIIFEQYWFATVYVVLMLFSPILNNIILMLDRSHYRKFLIVGGLILSIIPTFTIDGLSLIRNDFVWFTYLYFLAGFFRIHSQWIDQTFMGKNRTRWFWLFLLSYLIVIISSVSINMIGAHISFFQNRARYFSSTYSTLILMSTIGIFKYFELASFKESKIINVIASTTFGVYLLHDSMLRDLLWQSYVKNYFFELHFSSIIVHSIVSVLVVFSMCSCIELLRIKYIERVMIKRIQESYLIKKVVSYI